MGVASELTKSEKRISRELIHRGLERECMRFVEDIRRLSSATYEDVHAQYIDIYRKTKTFDKHVAWRYDEMTGSRYLSCVASLVSDGILTVDEIGGYSEEHQREIRVMCGMDA